jgi:hypothetical protein
MGDHGFIWLTVNDPAVRLAYIIGALLGLIIGGCIDLHWRWEYKKWPFGS